MQHDQLWAPWRLAYIKGEDRPRDVPDEELKFLAGADRTCFLCRAVADSADQENLLVERRPTSLVILNRYPYNNGHLLVAPLLHKGRLEDLTDEEHLEIQLTTTRFVTLLESLLKAEGFNIGLNLGRPAGAGLLGHVHWHIVPRWSGDTNFMGVLGGVEVIPQSLASLWQLLTEAVAAKGQP